MSSNDDKVALSDGLIVSEDNENRLVTASGGTLESAVWRKRLIVISFVMIATLALVLLMKTCTEPPDEWSFREKEDRVLVVEDETLVTTITDGSNHVKATDKAPASQQSGHVEKGTENSATLLGMQAKAAFRTGQAEAPPPPAGKVKPDSSWSAPGPGVSVNQQDLAPIVVAAVRRPVTVATAGLQEDSATHDSHQESTPSGLSEGALSDTSSHKDRDAVSTESAIAQDRQETILISFPFDSDDLMPDSHLALDRAAIMLRGNALSKASITGFTDNQGDTQYNLVLSRKRASAVERYLVDAGIARDRLRVEGRGVLTDPFDGQIAGARDVAEPYRIVRIKLGSDG